MTCIVWVVANWKVFIGWDTLWVEANNLSIAIRKDTKVFKNWDFVIWFSGSYRIWQILRYCIDLTLDATERETIWKDFMIYMCCVFINKIRNALEENFYKTAKDKPEVSDLIILVWYKDKLICIYPDFQVEECVFPFSSVWCWAELAKWILYEKLSEWKLKWKDSNISFQIMQTIEHVSKMNAWVGWESTVLTT